MQTILPRIIAHIFAPHDLSTKEVAHLKSRMSDTCQAQGRALIGVVVDRGPPKTDPADHISLQRIAFGDADELIVIQMPGVLLSRKSPDVLLSQLDRPVQIFSTSQFACRGLLLRGSLYTPKRTLDDAADLARTLRAEGLTFHAIARRLNAEGFQTSRRRHWYPSTVFKLLACGSREVKHAATEEPPRH